MEIESWLKDTVWGVIILGTIGGLLSTIILNFIGKANKGIKWLKIWYKEGNEEIYNKLLVDKYYFERIKFRITIINIKLGVTIVCNFMFILSDHIEIKDNLLINIAIFIIMILQFLLLYKYIRLDTIWTKASRALSSLEKENQDWEN